ncbi:MAG: DUF47 domain-containing protein [Geminicoccaceae bacterium]
MSENSESVVARMVDRVFPRMPDFYGLMNDQCDVLVTAMEDFVDYMRTGDKKTGKRIASVLEKQGDELKRRNLHILNKAFATPMDREEIYRAIEGIDHVINYAKTTVREMEALDLGPDAYTLEMAIHMKNGAEALRSGFLKIASAPHDAEANADAARKAERQIEKCYRRALAKLFAAEDHHAALAERGGGTGSDALRCMTEILKRREVYRHLSNGGDRLAHAGQTLHDIIVKIA